MADPEPASTSGLAELSDALAASEQKLSTFIDAVIDYAIISLDRTGVIESWNRGAQRLKGYAAEEIVGRHFSVFYTPEDQARGLPEYMLSTALAEGHVEHNGWRVRKGGGYFWGDVVVTAVYGPDGAHLGFIKVTRDLTERYQAELRDRAAREREMEMTENLLRMKTEFLNSVSHDLRTPITSIAGFAALLDNPKLPDPQRALANRQIAASARRLIGMVDSLMEVAELESGTARLRPETVNLREVMTAIVETIPIDLGEHQYVIDVPEDLNIVADRQGVERIVVNLCTNAAKFSPEGSEVRIEARALPDDEVIIAVEDQGKGISEADREIIFEKFHQTGLGKATGDGVGLGLSIVRDYVNLHGGRVWVEGKEGKGSRFVFTLPVAGPREPEFVESE